ncbi:MAG TPA: proline dehydrogenase family protein [Longimicrobiales bacterium]|nr:proline dehydrogenase family protein [Longimicrobiales bacterium]
MLRELLIFMSQSDALRRISMNAPGARTVARRFVAGESLDDGVAAVRRLCDAGFLATLDYLGESVASRDEARAAADMYLRMLERLASEQLANGEPLQTRANVSLKLTQMGQDIRAERSTPWPATWPLPARGMTPDGDGPFDNEFLRTNVGRIVDRARALDIMVRFDMEDSVHVNTTLDFVQSLWNEGYRNIGIVLQSYMIRAEHDARVASAQGMRVRLCKGAYKEPAEVAFQDKADVDRNYVHVATALLREGTYPGIATHDPAMISAVREVARSHGIDSARYEFQMLYGIRRDLQQQLIADGCNMRVYVPFGEAWYPYLMRRMAERPANMMFIVNSVLRESPLGALFGNGKR